LAQKNQKTKACETFAAFHQNSLSHATQALIIHNVNQMLQRNKRLILALEWWFKDGYAQANAQRIFGNPTQNLRRPIIRLYEEVK